MGSAAAQALCAESLTPDTGKTLLALGAGPGPRVPGRRGPLPTRHPRGRGSGPLRPASLPTGRDPLQGEWVTRPVLSVTGRKVVATAVL